MGNSQTKSEVKEKEWAAAFKEVRQRIKDKEANRREKTKQSVRRSLLKTKRECFQAYGNICACCGERREEFLTLDHVGGIKKTPKLVMRSYGYGAHAEYRALRDLGYPKENYRLLCMNCNFATKLGKNCPHEVEREARRKAGTGHERD